MKRRSCAIALCVAILCGFGVRADGLTMTPSATYATGTKPVRLAAADLNRDGVTDVVAINNGSSTASVFLGDPSGAFLLASSPTVVSQPVALAIADVNGDTKLDIITVGSANGNINLRLGDGAGRFPNTTKFTTSSASLRALAVGDLNADGKADVATDAPNGAVRVLLGNGGGDFTFAPGSPYSARTSPSSLAVADMNGDRWPDVVAASVAGGTVAVLRGSSTGALSLGAERSLSTRPGSIIVDDLDGDGANDVAVAEPDASAIVVLPGDGAGNLDAASTFEAPDGTRALATGDMNGDAITDLVAVSDTRDKVTIELNDGAGSYTAATGSPYATGGAPQDVLAVDVDRDGADDAVVAQTARNQVAVIRNTTSGGVSLDPATIDFGPVGAGSSSEAVAVSASSDGLVSTITGVTVDDPDFVIDADGCTDSRVGDGYGTCEVDVRFAPTDVGERDAVLSFAYGNDTVDVPLHGTAIDITPPETTITDGPEQLSNESEPSFAFASDDPTARFECAMDSADYVSCTSPYRAHVNDGDHTFSVQAIDPAGNIDPSPATSDFTVDSTPPNTTITEHAVADDSATFAFEADDPSATFECRLDGAPFTRCESPYEMASPEPGDHIFAVRATDEAGNTDDTPATYSFSVGGSGSGSGAPETTITEHPDALTNDTTPTFRFISDESGATFVCAIDDAVAETCSSPYTTNALGEGTHTFTVAAVDEVGSVDPTPDSFVVTIDVTTPRTTIRGPKRATRANARFMFRFSENVQSVWCSMDGSGYSECRTPYNNRALRPGKHLLRVRAVDPAGNGEPTPAVKRFTIVRRRR